MTRRPGNVPHISAVDLRCVRIHDLKLSRRKHDRRQGAPLRLRLAGRSCSDTPPSAAARRTSATLPTCLPVKIRPPVRPTPTRLHRAPLANADGYRVKGRSGTVSAANLCRCAPAPRRLYLTPVLHIALQAPLTPHATSGHPVLRIGASAAIRAADAPIRRPRQPNRRHPHAHQVHRLLRYRNS